MTIEYASCGTGTTAIVMLHGVGGGKGVFAPQMEPLAAAGFLAVAWDAPGYGASPKIEPYDMTGLASALAELLDTLPARRCVLLGHSMGGMVAQTFVALHPERAAGLVLSGTTPAFGKPDGAWQQAFLAQRLAPLDAGKSMAEVARTLVPTMVGPHAEAEGVRMATEVMSRVPPATYRAALAAIVGFDRRADLAAIRIPTLVLAGEHDANAPHAVMEKMAARIAGAEYRLLPGLGHLANLENPRVFNEAVVAWLKANAL